MRKKEKIIFLFVFLFAFCLRTVGINWDQGQHLHPDERFLTMVGTQLRLPNSFKEYFFSSSPFSPYYHGYNFFVYGVFPLHLTKLVAWGLGEDNYQGFTLVGRVLSALFDTGTTILIFLLSKSWWASFFYAAMVLPIQLSHFFAVDTFLVFFLVLTFFFLIRDWQGRKYSWLLAAVSFGLALSCKISAAFFAGVVFLFFFLAYFPRWFAFFAKGVSFAILSLLTWRFFDPHVFKGVFTPHPLFVEALRQLASWNQPQTTFPPALQWIKTPPLWFPFWNMVLWGWGVVLSFLVIFALVKTAKKLKNFWRQKEKTVLFLCFFWIVFLFVFQGVQFVKTMRYFLPLYPFAALVAGRYWQKKSKHWSRAKRVILLGGVMLWPLAFLQVYLHPHPRLAASRWIYKNIPPGRVLSCEYWDDCLPLPVEGKIPQQYSWEVLHVFAPDTPEKEQTIRSQIERVDYLILSSGRAWEVISKLPERYPFTSQFYRQLFAGQLGFKKVAEFTSYPQLLGIKIPDWWAEEAFTVYDHPRVIIFENQASLLSR